MYSPPIYVSDTWDLVDHGIGPPVTEVPDSPRPLELPPPLSRCGAQGKTDRGDTVATYESGCSPPERSRKGRTTASEIPEPTASVSPDSSQMSHPIDASSANSPLPPSPSDDSTASTTSRTTTTTAPNPPSDSEVEIPQSPLAPERSRQQRKTTEPPDADACLQEPVGQSKSKGKRRFDELEDSDLDDELRMKRMRRDMG